MFVVTAAYGRIQTSPDGIKWTTHTTGTGDNLSKATYGNGKFVAVGDAGSILSSVNGTIWTINTTITANSLSGITYGNGKFIIVGKADILTSPDAISWTHQSSCSSYSPSGATYGNGKFVVVGQNGVIMTSPDGIKWTTQSYEILGFNGITYGNGRFIALGNFGSIMTSRDGVSWTQQEPVTSYCLFKVIYGNGKFVVVGQAGFIMTSPDGIKWTAQSSGSFYNLNDITYGNGKFVAVGSYVDYDGSVSGTILTSPDGVNWKTRSSGVSYSLNGVTYGKGKFVAVGGGSDVYDDFFGATLTSPDGVNWTPPQISYSTSVLFSVIYKNGWFVSVGYPIYTSPDGVNWTDQTSDTFYLLYSITYGNGKFVAVGDANVTNVIGDAIIIVSNKLPDILSASSSSLNGYYKAGSDINITLNFTEPVSSTGLTIKLNSGALIDTGPFNNLTSYGFTYTVSLGQNVQALNISSISGTIIDIHGVKGYPVVPLGNNISNYKKIVIDTIAPQVTISNPSVPVTQNGPVTYEITYTDTNFKSSTISAKDVIINKSGTANGIISSVTGTGNKRTITISSITGNGTLGLSIASGTASDKAGNAALAAGPSVTVTVTP